MEVNGLAATLEAIEAVRTKLRKDKKLFTFPSSQSYCEPNRINAVNNSDVLFPLIRQLRATSDWKLPHLEPLQAEMLKLFEKLAVGVEDTQLYTTAVEAKRLLGFVKRRVKRRQVTKDHVSLQKNDNMMMYFHGCISLRNTWYLVGPLPPPLYHYEF